MKLFFASKNAHKFAEISNLISFKNIEFIQADAAYPEIQETASSFLENALIKAQAGIRYSNCACLAEDSGLCIPLLSNQPGIHSAEYSGTRDHSKNNNLLIERLHDIRRENQQINAFFYCAMVLIRHPNDPTPYIGIGKVWGEILANPKGCHGFGYDPLFYLPKLNKTLAELSFHEKNQHSARAAAFDDLINQTAFDDIPA